jgi:hypothetical protein
VKTLPYTFPNFVAHVRKSVALFKSLEVLPPECHVPLDDLVEVVEAELEQLKMRIAVWCTEDHTPEQHREHERMTDDKPSRDDPQTALENVPANKSLRNSRLLSKTLSLLVVPTEEQPDWQEGFKPGDEEQTAQFILDDEKYAEEKIEEFLSSWQQVILTETEEAVDGCMIQVRWWYETFMPALCRAFTVRCAADLVDPTEEKVDEWFRGELAAGAFDPYGPDIKSGWQHVASDAKLMVSRAWRLTQDYLNGIQKQRERQQDGVAHRATGGVARYVPFIDVYLHRMFVAHAEMRVSFPYFLGYTTWRFFHTVPEIMAARDEAAVERIVDALKSFLATFITMYPCPYCRHHLNAYVLTTSERDTYPIEYTLLGLEPDRAVQELTPTDKLRTITDAESARLFMWKLHNAVNSSIERGEEWYRRVKMPVYTSRFWPNLDAEVARSKVVDGGLLSAERVEHYTTLFKPMASLERLRKRMLDAQTVDDVSAMRTEATEYIRLLEEAVLQSGYLQRTYRYNPDLVERPFVSSTLAPFGDYARSQEFVLW